MNISVFGLGYTGCVSAACLAQLGHQVIGVDISYKKVSLVQSGRSPIVEPELDAMIAAQVQAGRLSATQDTGQAVNESKLVFICVGTPDDGSGAVDYKQVERACSDIGAALRSRQDFVTIVLRSTVLPGIARRKAIAALENSSGKKAGAGFGFVLNPEFLREGSGVYDFFHPAMTVIAAGDACSAATMKELYAPIDNNICFVGLDEASMIKFVNNAFHAVKVSFANEIGRLCKEMHIDTRAVYDMFIRDEKLNISPAYLQPGFAFGGSCLPKDLRTLAAAGKNLKLTLPLLGAALSSNAEHIDYAFNLITSGGKQTIGFLGLSFKSETDDLRESPYVTLVQRLLAEHYRVHVYDNNVQINGLFGVNKEFVEKNLPDLAGIFCTSAAQVIAESDVIVIANNPQKYKNDLTGLAGKKIIDLSFLGNAGFFNAAKEDYEGLCW
ncbi:MAG TPA: nucleotide sugar dehydrogenase [bacterium]|mgnify:CR=1 FL=1|nr:nucleotide sugar dehydrogenase [bacterium]HPN46247.1 nucleotide sugar dehydrogenase [bacterium]